MKPIAITLLISIALIFSCRKNDTIPACIQSEIEALKGLSCQHGASIKEYAFQGQIVYVSYIGNCMSDVSANVMDQDCNSLGYLGGFAGNTKINGVEFSIAVYRRTVWSKP